MTDPKNTNTLPQFQQASDEIDLFKIFELIQKGFFSLKQSIANLLKFILRLVLHILLLIKKNLLALIGVFVVGVAIGYFIEQRKAPIYTSEMVVEPTGKSVRQLYTNIEEFNHLVEEEKFDILAKKLTISLQEAQSIQEIEIRPVLSENQLLKMYASYVKQLGITEESILTPVSFEEFKDKLVKYENKQHQILFTSEIPTLAKKCEDKLLDVFSRNSYIGQLKNINKEKLKEKERLLIKQLANVTDLKEFHKQTTLMHLQERSTSEADGTQINLSNTKITENELIISLLDKADNIEQQRIGIQSSLFQNEQTIVKVSTFPDFGYEDQYFLTRPIIIMPILLLVLFLSVTLVIALNKILVIFDLSDKKKQWKLEDVL